MEDWKVIKRLTKAEGGMVVRSLKLPPELDAYCSLQGNASEFIRSLIRHHKEGHEIVELTDTEEHMRGAIMDYYIFDLKLEWSRANFDAEKIYPSVGNITDAQLDDMLEKIMTSFGRVRFRTDEDWSFLERCKQDRNLWRRVYAKIRSAELAYHRRVRAQAEESKRRFGS
jgi:hypothetical protein